jgi:hypothetical protein
MGAPASMDWRWARRTGGILSGAQQRALAVELAKVVARYPGSRLRTALGRRGGARLDLDALRWPDSSLARDAEAEAIAVLSPHMLHHSYRVYVLGLLLAQIEGARVDEELAFVASILHDTHLEHPTPGRCFAVVGGERAERFALDHGAAPDAASAAGAAIGAHITVGAGDDLSDLGGFVSAGAFTDITGFRLDEVDPAWVARLLERHPRHGLTRHLLRAWRAESRAVPGGRAQWLTRYGAFPLLLRAAPYAE